MCVSLSVCLHTDDDVSNKHVLSCGPSLCVQESGSDQVVFMQLDLGSLKSVRGFAENFLKSERRLDLLINNAGSTAHCSFN